MNRYVGNACPRILNPIFEGNKATMRNAEIFFVSSDGPPARIRERKN